MKINKLLPVVTLLGVFLLAACAHDTTRPASVEENVNSTTPTSQNKSPVLLKTSNLSDMLSDSEVSVTFPQESPPTISNLSVVSKGDVGILARALSRKKLVREAQLNQLQFKEILKEIQGLNYNANEHEDVTHCDIYSLRLRVATDEIKMVGCRWASHNGTIVSRLAHKLQFYLLAGQSH